MSREAMKQALDALECAKEETNSEEMRYAYGVTIAALQAALAEQPAAPVTEDQAVRLYEAGRKSAIPPGYCVVPVGEIEALRRDHRCAGLEGDETGSPCNTYKLLEARHAEEVEALRKALDPFARRNFREDDFHRARTVMAARPGGRG